MDALALLRLQIEWGADEALETMPVDRLASRAGALAANPCLATLIHAPVAAVRAPPVRPPPALARTADPQAATRASEVAAACATRDALRAALASFDGCPLATTATNLVFADGNPDSGLMLVGEGPGAEEDRAGLPFVGPSGQLLDRMLASIGIDRTRCLITNLIPWRPPGNRNPTEAEVLTCLPFLLRHIALVRPHHLVLLGNVPVQALVGGRTGITRMRGKWIELRVPGVPDPIPTLPMLHPAYLLRTPGAKREAWADWLMLRRTIDHFA